MKNSIASGTIVQLKSDLKECDEIIQDLQVSNKSATESAKKLNKKLNDNRKLYEEEKKITFNDHKKEIKAWKRDLGKAVSNHVKLEKKLALLEAKDPLSGNYIQDHTSTMPALTDPVFPEASYPEDEICSICSITIPNYSPSYFMGEMFNPACKKCKGPDEEEYFFASFPNPGMPSSLVSHWVPPHTISPLCFTTYQSLRAHYVAIPNLGDSFISTQEVLREFKLLWDEQRKAMRNEWEEQRKAMRNECKQS